MNVFGGKRVVVNRDLSEDENYSGGALKAGTLLYLYYGCTYGCISPGGTARTFELDKEPFFEVPDDALERT
jgi:hypothetical protein